MNNPKFFIHFCQLRLVAVQSFRSFLLVVFGRFTFGRVFTAAGDVTCLDLDLRLLGSL